MKRIFIAIFIIAGFAASSHAIQDQWGSERPALWRSSRTCAAINFVPIATGPVHLHAVIVETPTVTANSYWSVYNGTQNANGATFNFNIDTAAFFPTQMTIFNQTVSVADDIAIIYNSEWPKTMVYDVQMSSGMVLNKVGAGACTCTLWDYIDPRLALRNQQIVPFKP